MGPLQITEETRLARARAINAPVFKSGPFLFRRTLPKNGAEEQIRTAASLRILITNQA